MHIDDNDRPGDEFDWDQSDDSQRCEHGTFIGSWWGPDILCSPCEDGISVEEFKAIRAAARRQRLVTLATAKLWDDVDPIVKGRQFHDPNKLSEWFGSLIDEAKATPTHDLELYLDRLDRLRDPVTAASPAPGTSSEPPALGVGG